MKNKKIWIIVVAVLILAGAGYYFRTNILSLVGVQTATTQTQGPGGSGFDPADLPTTTIRAAGDSAQVSAAGNIELISQQQVALEVAGIVAQVTVEVGDPVTTNQLLVVMDTTDLERAVTQAELNVDTAQAQLDDLIEPPSEADLASAKANLASAQENLADVKAGATTAELAAAESDLATAESDYQDLVDGPSEAELTSMAADLQKATITLQEAQWAYDKIAYKGNIGETSEAATLQEATISYDVAKVSYLEATEPATDAEIQAAQSKIETAQETLDDLRTKPTAADLASAEAQVASAQATLNNLLEGASQSEIRQAENQLTQAQIDLESTQSDLDAARLYSPIDGTVLAVNVEVGERATSDTATNAVTVADLNELQLAVNVAEVDISKVYVGQPAKITVDALPDVEFSGEVSHIAPTSSSSSGVVNYPVTIKITDSDLFGVRPGMTAVADLLSAELNDSWLVPSSAVREQENGAVVMIVREGKPSPISVATQGTQGEWTIVQSPELKEGDEALGTVTSL